MKKSTMETRGRGGSWSMMTEGRRISWIPLLTSASLLLALPTQAGTITKLNNTTRIDSGTSWTGGVAPTGSDGGLFDSTITGPLTIGNLSGNYAPGNLQFTSIGGTVTIGVGGAAASTALTLSSNTTYEIDMSAAAADVTIGSVVDGGQCRWASGSYGGISVAAGRTLTINSRFSNAGNNKTVTLTGPGNIVLNANSGGGNAAFGFSIQGGANVTMNAANSWGGTSSKVIINGTLNLGNDSALGSVTLTLGGTSSTTPTLTATGGARTIANAITLVAVTTGNATIAGSQDLTVNGVLTVSGGNRTLTVNNSGLTTFGTGGIALSESSTSRTLTINGSGNTTVSGAIVNGSTATASSLTKDGTGTLTLSGANSYGGMTTVTGGKVLLSGSGTLGSGAALTMGGGVLDLGGGSATVGAVSITTAAASGDTITNGTLTGTSYAASPASGNAVVSAILAGSGWLTKSGAGALTLSGANTYSGNTTNSAGTLQLGASGVIPDGSGNGSVELTGGTLDLNGYSETINGLTGAGTVDTVAGGTPTLTVGNNDATSTFAGLITNSSGTLALTKTGAGTLTLSGLNAYTGTSTLNAGTLVYSNATALGNGGNVTFGGGLLKYGTGFTTDLSGRLKNSTAAISIDDNGQAVTFASALDSSNTSGLTKAGAGTLTLSGVNAYSGVTTISAGTLLISGLGQLGSGTYVGDITDNGNLNYGSSAAQTLSGVISGTGSLTNSDSGTLTLSGNNSYSGNTVISVGAIKLGAANVIPDGASKGNVTVTGTLDLNTYSETVNGLTGAGTVDTVAGGTPVLTVGNNDQGGTWSGMLTNSSGSLAVTKIGSGTWTLTTTNGYTGGTLISEGKIQLSGNNNGGLGSGTVLLNGGTLGLYSLGASGTSAGTFPNTLQVDSGYSGTLIGFGRGSLNSTLLGGGTFNYQTDYIRADVNGNWSGFTGQINVTPGPNGGDFRINNMNGFGTAKINLASGVYGYMNVNFGSTLANTIGELTGNGTLAGGPTSGRTMTWNVGGANTTAEFAGQIQNRTGPTAITKSGTGTWTLSNTNTYSGVTTISNGVLAAGVPMIITNSALTVVSGGTFSNNHSQIVQSIAGSGTIDLGISGALSNGFNDTSTTFSGSIIGGGVIAKYGAGTLTLSGNNTYSGGTIVENGMLKLSNSASAYPGYALTVNGGIFNQNGNAIHVTTLNGIGGTITNDGLTVTSGGNFGGVIAGAGTLVNNGGTLTLSNTNTFTGATTISNGVLALTCPWALSNTVSLATVSGATCDVSSVAGGYTLGAAQTLKGTGLVKGDLTVLGVNSPGFSPGTLTIDGNYTNDASATLLIEIAASNSFDQVVVTGNAQLGGTLTVTNIGDYALLSGSTYTVLTATAVSGSFAATNLPAVAAGLTCVAIQTPTAVIIQVSGTPTATTYWWDSNGSTAGVGGAGTWNTTDLAWRSPATNDLLTVYPSVVSNGDTAVFAGMAGEVTHSGTLYVGSLVFRIDGYTLSGGSFDISGAASAGVVVSNGVGATISSTLTGANSLIKDGGGMLTLSGGNSYTGNTTIHAGTLSISADNGLGSAPGVATPGSLIITNGTLAVTAGFTLDSNRGLALGPTSGSGTATIDVATGQALVYGGVVANNGGTGALIKTGAGTLTLSGVNTYAGKTTVSNGTLGVSADSGLGTAPGSVTADQLKLDGGTFSASETFSMSANRGITVGAGGGTIDVAAGKTLTYTRMVNGTGALTKNGAGTLDLSYSSADSTYNGFTLNDGTLAINKSSIGAGIVLINSGRIQTDNATARSPGNAVVLNGNVILGASGTANLTFTGGWTISNATRTITVDTITATISGAVGDNASGYGLIKDGGGTLALSGVNTYGGGTTVGAGTLVHSNDQALGTSGNITFTGGTLKYGTGFTTDLSGRIVNSTGAISINDNGQAVTFGSALDSSNIGGLTKSGVGTLTLAAANSYGGNTTNSSGTLVLGHAAAISSGTLVMAGGNLDSSVASLVNANNNPQSWNASFTFIGSQSLDLGAGAVTLGATPTVTVSGNTLTIGGNISGGYGLTKAGSGTLTLSGANNYTAGTLVSGGVLNLVGSCIPASGTSANLGIVNGAIYQSGSYTATYSATPNRAIVLGGNWATALGGYGYHSLSGGTLSAGSGGQIEVGGNGSTTSGTIIGILEISGGTASAGGLFQIARGTGASGLVNITGGGVTVGTTMQGASGANNVNSTVNVGGGAGTATLTISGTSSGQGLDLAAAVPTAGSPSIANLLANGTLTASEVTAANASPVASLNFNGGTLKSLNPNALSASFLASANIDNVVVYGGGGTIDNNGVNITISRPLVAASGSGVTSIPVATGGAGYIGAPFVQISGDGSGASAYAQIDRTSGQVTNIVITSPGKDYTVAPTVTLLGGGYTAAATLGAVTIGLNGADGGMAFKGAGITTLSAAATYVGQTTVSNGTLAIGAGAMPTATSGYLVNGTLDVTALGTLALNGTQWLGGTGTVNGAVATVSGTILAPGTGTATTGGAGTNTISNLTLADGTVINFGLTAGKASATMINVTNALALPSSGTVTVNLYDPGTATPFAYAGQYNLFKYTSIDSDPASKFTIGTDITGYTASFSTNGTYVVLTLASSPRVWVGAVGATWAGNGNWSPADSPGLDASAIFSNSAAVVNNNTTVDLGGGASVSNILFDTADAAAYTIGSAGQTLTLNNNAVVTMSGSVATNQAIGANLVFGDATAQGMNWANSASGKTLTFAGTVQGGVGGTAGVKTLNFAATGPVTFQDAITAGGSASIRLINTGTGNLTLSGSGASSSFDTLRATAGGTVTVTGQTVTVASSSAYGAGSNFGRFILQTGNVAFNGGIQSATSSGALAGSDTMAFIVNGGTFSASYVALGRSQNVGSSFLTTAASLVYGFLVNGGTADVTGSVNISGSNSSADGQVAGSGSLTIGGELILGARAASGRVNFFQVTGGTLNVTDAIGGGIVLMKSSTEAGKGQLLLTGGTTTTETITFGMNGGLAGSSGNVTLNGAGASLYIGSGGIVLAASNPYTYMIDLRSGTLGAKADWASSLDIGLNSGAVTFKAADASDVARTITLNGVLSGVGGITKSGAGTLVLNGANTYAGATTLDAGSLQVAGSIASPTQVKAGAILAGSGSVSNSVTLQAGGILSLTNDVAGTMTITGGLNVTNAVVNMGLGTLSDRIELATSALNGAGTTTVNIVANAGFAVGTYDLITGISGAVPVASFTVGAMPNGFTASFKDSGDGKLQLEVRDLTGSVYKIR